MPDPFDDEPLSACEHGFARAPDGIRRCEDALLPSALRTDEVIERTMAGVDGEPTAVVDVERSSGLRTCQRDREPRIRTVAMFGNGDALAAAHSASGVARTNLRPAQRERLDRRIRLPHFAPSDDAVAVRIEREERF